MKFEMQVGIIKSYHFATFKQNQSKGMGSNRKELNFQKSAKNWLTPD